MEVYSLLMVALTLNIKKHSPQRNTLTKCGELTHRCLNYLSSARCLRLDHLGRCGGLARMHTGILRHLDHLNKIRSRHDQGQGEAHLVHHLARGVDLLHHLHSPGLPGLNHLHSPGGGLLT